MNAGYELFVKDSATVWGNTAGMSLASRVATTAGFFLADVTGVRGVDDFFHTHDAADGHVQSRFEQWADGALGVIGVGGTIFGGVAAAKVAQTLGVKGTVTAGAAYARATVARVGTGARGMVDDVLRAGKNAIAPIRVADFSQSTGRLGGELYGEVRLGKLSRYLERRNVRLVRDADARIDALNPNGNGVFIANRKKPSELLLRSNATRAEVLHELSHFRHMKRVEFDDYIRAGRLGREQTVYDTIKNNRHWSQMTQAERDAAFDYILRLGGNPFGGGRP